MVAKEGAESPLIIDTGVEKNRLQQTNRQELTMRLVALVLTTLLCPGTIAAQSHHDHHHHPPAVIAGDDAPAEIAIDGSKSFQRFEGFGGSLGIFEKDGIFKAHDHTQPAVVSATANQRSDLASMPHAQIGVSRARIVLSGFEPQNDNADPFVASGSGFDWKETDFHASALASGKSLGLRTPWISFSLDGSDADAWRRRSGSACALDPVFVDEEVEWILEALQHFKDLGMELPYATVNNEPDLCDSGYKIEIADYVEIVKQLGRRLRERGIETKLVVSDGWVPQNAVLYMEAVLADADARQYVGALAFHSYDAYDNPQAILAAADAGPPLHEATQRRERIRELAATYALPVWMTEVCYCNPRELRDWELLRARLNHIHDELTVTNVAALDVMNLWFIRRPQVNDELVEVFFNPAGPLERSEISQYGTLVAHWARFIPPGALRVAVRSSEPRIRVTAFRSETGASTMVMLNNATTARSIRLEFSGIGSVRSLSSITSGEEYLWQIGSAVGVTDGRVEVAVPSRGVMTLTTLATCGGSGRPSKPCRRRAVRP
ncbi:MAG: hypothetical protein NDI75_16140 [Candidatus Didemnitutus sp.]|nr:hypothetical protein [Candidatus Didemnitutus sp.]